MKNLFSFSLVILLALSPSAFAWSILRDNKVIFSLIDLQMNSTAVASFGVARHSITNGQPCGIKDNAFLPATVGSFNKVLLNDLPLIDTQFEIFAGRHKSAQVYNDLMAWGYDTVGVPTQMNFAVEGTLSFTSSKKGMTLLCKDIALSQTGVGLSNRWYVFSKYGTGTYLGVRYTNILCTDQNGVNYKLQISNPTFYENNGFIVADGIYLRGYGIVPVP